MQQDGEQQQQKAAKQVLGVSTDGLLEMRLRLVRLTRYVEHPVPLEPPDEGPPPAPQPLKLTKRELKKLRTQRRQAREKEKQELMRWVVVQGL
jgi:U4/U6 small nuclear ribonucleoprotein PRP3